MSKTDNARLAKEASQAVAAMRAQAIDIPGDVWELAGKLLIALDKWKKETA